MHQSNIAGWWNNIAIAQAESYILSESSQDFLSICCCSLFSVRGILAKVAIIIKRIPTLIVLYESIGEYSNVVSKVSAVPALCPIIPPAVPNTAANPKQAKPTGIPTPVPRAAIPMLTTAPVVDLLLPQLLHLSSCHYLITINYFCRVRGLYLTES